MRRGSVSYLEEVVIRDGIQPTDEAHDVLSIRSDEADEFYGTLTAGRDWSPT